MCFAWVVRLELEMLDEEELLARTRGQWRGSLPWRFGDKACDEKRSCSGLGL